jgi:hypothetical protein
MIAIRCHARAFHRGFLLTVLHTALHIALQGLTVRSN